MANRMQERVLALLRKRCVPLSAYDMLETLRPSDPKLAPTTIYRALSVLVARGQVHRVESLNAYVICRCDQHDICAILSICDDCGAVEESVAPDVVRRLTAVAGKTGFVPARHVLELRGTCAACVVTEAQA